MELKDKCKINWTTWNNRVVTESTITHQHLSNIFWYFKVIQNPLSPSTQNKLKCILDTQFKSILLPYKPEITFIEEIEYLFLNNFLRVNTNDYSVYDIFFQGEIIGTLPKINSYTNN